VPAPEDPITTHACPGKNVRKLEVIQEVSDPITERHAGEHSPDAEASAGPVVGPVVADDGMPGMPRWVTWVQLVFSAFVAVVTVVVKLQQDQLQTEPRGIADDQEIIEKKQADLDLVAKTKGQTVELTEVLT
jgi:hypothetical protein